jgi:hypothetical protein
LLFDRIKEDREKERGRNGQLIGKKKNYEAKWEAK